jgi:hypothetical protein
MGDFDGNSNIGYFIDCIFDWPVVFIPMASFIG